MYKEDIYIEDEHVESQMYFNTHKPRNVVYASTVHVLYALDTAYYHIQHSINHTK